MREDFPTCVIRLLPFPLRVPGDDLGDELSGRRLNVGQKRAIIGPTGKGIPIDLDQARGRGRGRGQVVMGGGGSGMSPKLSLPVPHRPVPVTVRAPSQEELGKALSAGLGPSRPGPEEGRGRGQGRGRGSQREGRVRKGRGRSRGGLVEGGCVRAGGRPENSTGGEDGRRKEEGERKRQVSCELWRPKQGQTTRTKIKQGRDAELRDTNDSGSKMASTH